MSSNYDFEPNRLAEEWGQRTVGFLGLGGLSRFVLSHPAQPAAATALAWAPVSSLRLRAPGQEAVQSGGNKTTLDWAVLDWAVAD